MSLKVKSFFIDIRKSDEVFATRFTNDIPHLCIPANMIRFNLQFLRDFVKSKPDTIFYLVCYSSNRSSFIYNKYFANDEILKNIKVSNLIQFKYLQFFTNQENITKESELIRNELGYLPTVINKGYNFYSLTRVLQTILGLLLIITSLLLWNKCNKKRKWVLWLVLIMGVNALFNGLTSTCTISKLFMNYLN
jgi:rhodanese-related sulfurtransferase